jgi:ribosomal protein S27E
LRTGKKGYKGTAFMLIPCPECGKERYLYKKHILAGKSLLCASCTHKGNRSSKWVGGKYINSSGYIQVLLTADNPFYKMCQKHSHCVMEHRLVVAQSLGRCLEEWEVVHHINGNKTDNRLENLELLPSQGNHVPYLKMQLEIKQLQQRVTQLEAENILLKSQIGVKL